MAGERIRLDWLRERVEGQRRRCAPYKPSSWLSVDPDALLALVEAVQADIALAAGEERGVDLDPAEHRELIARHDAALAVFDGEER